jgi:hypothetical protein
MVTGWQYNLGLACTYGVRGSYDHCYILWLIFVLLNRLLIESDTGEAEILILPLLDTDTHPYEFAALYHL